jgi:hypothetical protein
MTSRHDRHPRDSGGAFRLHNPDDGSAIREAIPLSDRLLMITDKCMYSIRVANQIDPARTNPALPHNVQQKVFDYGADSELVCRSFLQAWRLFREGFQTIDNAAATERAFDALGEFVAMQGIAEEFKAAQNRAIEKADNAGRDGSLAIPSVGNVRADCKSFAQKADHCAATLHAIFLMFYPSIKKANWDELRAVVEKQFGPDDEFSKFMAAATPFLQTLRNTRDCLDHRNVSGVVTHDFELHADGQIGLPSIEVNFRGSVVKRCAISIFMNESIQKSLDVFEQMIVHLCAKNVQPFAGMPMTLAPLSDEYRRAWRVRYAYGAYYADGKFAPCG